MKKVSLFLFLCSLTLFVQAKPIGTFHEEDVTFQNEDTLHYGGTLTLPDGQKRSTAVIILSGSYPQNRDGEMAGHLVYKEIAEYLSHRGYAVLRVDDRGVGGTNGVYDDATTEDFAKDALAAVRYLKSRKDILRIGLLGHSEGAAAASIAASRSKDVKFLISVSGLISDGLSALIRQNYDIVHNSPIPERDMKRYDEINDLMFRTVYAHANEDSLSLANAINKVYDEWKRKDDEYIKQLGIEFDHFRFPIYMYTIQATSPWYRFHIKYDPARYLSKVKIPVLALNGTKDVMVNCEESLANVKRYLSHNRDVTTVPIEGVNHLLLPCEKGTQDEYRSIKAPVSEMVLQTIYNWLKERF